MWTQSPPPSGQAGSTGATMCLCSLGQPHPFTRCSITSSSHDITVPLKPPLALCFHQWWTRACMPCLQSLQQQRWRTATVTTAETHYLLPHCVCIHYLVSINVWRASENASGCHFFCMRNSRTHLCFVPSSMSDAILSNYPSAATEWNAVEYWWEGSVSTAIPSTSASDVVRHFHVGITFRAVLIQSTHVKWVAFASSLPLHTFFLFSQTRTSCA